MAWMGKQLWELRRDTFVAIKTGDKHGYTGCMLWEPKFLFLGSGYVRTC